MSAWLFVPGHRPDRFDKALAAGAQAVIIDLEDAVAPPDKVAARESLSRWLAGTSARVVLRLNSADSEWFADDLALVASPAVAAVMLPKAESVDTLAVVAAQRPGVALVPLVESAAGFANLRAIAAAPGVQRLAFGSIDFQVDMGMRDATEDELLPFRAEFVLASRLGRIGAPLDGVTVAIDDAARLQHDVQRARRLGFGGKLCIHPKQVAAVHAGFAPGAHELAWAERVLQAAAQAAGAAVAVDGKMVDKPVILRAEAILRDAGR
ncbi:CoA ester lyase [Ideonella sp. A 288]|uniref:HpcH/HpaI aldolase/citrate lyase family protein n=1 Tax=Ideonella sp. A 288 TaxID=1962181 RepID=UPI000B4AAA4A|nr:CoA ester lyase [Ideonella sp. A 288]